MPAESSPPIGREHTKSENIEESETEKKAVLPTHYIDDGFRKEKDIITKGLDLEAFQDVSSPDV
jgi:hypothetical protein